jgi:alcohol dehydrogenase YqhD (iron-dependent ADH family)
MPTSLRDLGINDKSVLDELAHRCAENNGGTVGRFAVLNEADIRNILELAY